MNQSHTGNTEVPKWQKVFESRHHRLVLFCLKNFRKNKEELLLLLLFCGYNVVHKSVNYLQTKKLQCTKQFLDQLEKLLCTPY